MLGAVSEHSARIWVRSTEPSEIYCVVSEIDNPTEKSEQVLHSSPTSDHAGVITFENLKMDTEYQYVVRVGKEQRQASFRTLGPSLRTNGVRLVYGSCYDHADNKMKPGTSIFQNMASRQADLVLFLGDFPYTARGGRKELWEGHKRLRELVGFDLLTSSTPSYGIYDDHDFGPNDCDGTHRNADGALAAFKEYWANPSYGLPEGEGIYCSFVVGDVEFFLLDGRHPARKKQNTMLGEVQLKWVCDGLKSSKSRYKVLVSGTPFSRVKADCWAGEHYLAERQKLFAFIEEHDITGVIGISGDLHRSDVSKLPIGKGRYFYDFTSGALSQTHRPPPKDKPESLIHSYGKKLDNNMFSEIDFRPSSDEEVSIIYRSFSAKNGLIYELSLSSSDLGIKE